MPCEWQGTDILVMKTVRGLDGAIAGGASGAEVTREAQEIFDKLKNTMPSTGSRRRRAYF